MPNSPRARLAPNGLKGMAGWMVHTIAWVLDTGHREVLLVVVVVVVGVGGHGGGVTWGLSYVVSTL